MAAAYSKYHRILVNDLEVRKPELRRGEQKLEGLVDVTKG